MALTFIPANAQHIGKRQEQQDSFGFSDPDDRDFVSHGGLLAVVADGMGGLADGAAASRRAVESFHRVYRTKDRKEAIQSALRRCLAEANRAVAAAVGGSGHGNCGTTIAAAVLHQSCLYWIAVGDTRIYLLRSGRLVRVNIDHNYRTQLWAVIAEGRADRDSAYNDPRAAHLTSYLGMPETPGADASARPFPLMRDDLIIICTDGAYRAVNEDEIAATFSRLTPDAACESVQASTLSKGHAHQDNLTIISIQCRDAAGPGVPSARKHSRRIILTTALCMEAALAAALTAHLVRPQWTLPISGIKVRPAATSTSTARPRPAQAPPGRAGTATTRTPQVSPKPSPLPRPAAAPSIEKKTDQAPKGLPENSGAK